MKEFALYSHILLLLLPGLFSTTISDKCALFKTRPKRDSDEFYSANSMTAVERLDAEIYHLLDKLPGLIEAAIDTIESDISFSNLKAQTQGYSIIAAGFKDIIGHWMVNNINATKIQSQLGTSLITGDESVLFQYGFFFFYGLGFGGPLILGRQSSDLSCNSYDFISLAKSYGLEHGVSDYFPSSDHALPSQLNSRINEFDLLLQSRLNCVLSKQDEYIEAAEVTWALEELIAALNARIEVADLSAHILKERFSSGNDIIYAAA